MYYTLYVHERYIKYSDYLCTDSWPYSYNNLSIKSLLIRVKTNIYQYTCKETTVDFIYKLIISEKSTICLK